jgi:protein O-mannosyl-transferase
LSKTVTATLPAALLVIFWWQRGRLSWRRDVLPLLPFFAMGAAAGIFTAWVERKLIGAEGAAFDLTLVERGLIAGRVIWFYLAKLLWPADLLFIYPRWHVSQAVWWQYLFPLAALSMLIGLWALRRRWRGPLAGMLYFVGTLLPALGFFNVFPFIFSYVADHFQYLASLGIISLAAAGAALLLARWRLGGQLLGYTACWMVLATLAGLTWRQNQRYADVETLYRTVIDENPECWMAYNNLGGTLLKRGQIDEAIACCRTALNLRPRYEEAHCNLGMALAQKGRVDEAIVECQKALDIQPNRAVTQNNLGVFFANCQRLDEAIVQFQRAVEIDPDYADARTNLGVARSEREKLLKAVAERRELLRSRPKDVSLLADTAWLLATNPNASVRNGAEAVELARRAVELSDGREPAVLSVLAAALAEAGQFSQAIETARKAVELATQQNKPSLAESIKAQILLYEAGMPCRDIRRRFAPASGHP